MLSFNLDTEPNTFVRLATNPEFEMVEYKRLSKEKIYSIKE